MAQKRTLAILQERCDAAYTEYLKYKGMIEFFESDPAFARRMHAAKVQAMNGAKVLNGHRDPAATRKSIAKAWTPKRRKEQAARLRKAILAKGIHKRKGAAWRKWTPERTAKFQATMKAKAAAKAAAASQ